MGVLPEHLISSFEECPDDLTLYYIEGKEGWSSPTVTVGGVEYRTAAQSLTSLLTKSAGARIIIMEKFFA